MILVSDYLMNALLNHTFRNTSFTPPSAVYLALLKEVPIRQTASVSGEVSGGSYARQSITFGAAANQRVLNSAAVTFPTPTANWATDAAPIIAVAVMDAASSGNWLVAHVLCKPRRVLSGDQAPTFKVNAIKITGDLLFAG